MSDTQKLVEEIRSFLGGADQTLNDDVAQWAVDYAQACRDINLRLRQCREYLQKGLRSEALHLAEKHPAVLDVVTSLDFPELEQWRETCMQYNLKEPPRLAMEAAQSISDAYSEEAPLATLLSAHRTLNLAQAPLAPRLRVLRKISDADPTTPFWIEDLQRLERLRLNEMQEELPAVIKRANTSEVNALLQEVESPGWRIPLPPKLRNHLLSTVRQLELRDAEQELRRQLPLLNKAYSAMDVDECRRQLLAWDGIVAHHQMETPPDMAEQVESARAWLADEDGKLAQREEFEEACAALQQGLDKDRPTLELERLHRATVAYPLELPEPLEKRYSGRLEARSRAARRRVIVMTTSAVSLAVIVIVLLGLWFYISTHKAHVSQWAKAASDAKSELALNPDFDLIRAMAVRKNIEDQGGRFLNEPEVSQAIASLADAVAKEQLRVDAFAASAKELEELTSQLKLGGTIVMGASGKTSLERCRELAKKASELRLFHDLEEDIKNNEAQIQGNIDTQFIAEMQQLSNEIDQKLTETQLREHMGDFIRTLAGIEARYAAAMSRTTVSSTTRGSLGDSVKTLIAQRRGMLGKGEAERFALENVAASEEIDSHTKAIKAYCDKFPDGIKASDFQKVLIRSDANRAVDEWIRVSESWKQPIPSSPAGASLRLETIGKYLQAFPNSPLAGQIGAYRDYLKAGVDALSEEGSYRGTLHSLFNNKLMTSMWMVETTDGKRFFTPAKPEVRESLGNITFNAYLSDDLERTSAVTPDKKGTRIKKLGADGVADRAPQQFLAVACQRQLATASFANWPTLGLDILEQVRKADKLDPVLFGIVLQRTLQTNSDMLSWAIGDELSKPAAALADLKLTDIAWMDPDSQRPGNLDERLQDAVKAIPDLQQMRASINQKIQAATALVNLNMPGRGVLIARLGEPRSVNTRAALKDGMTLWVVRDSTTDASTSPLIKIGDVQKGEVVLNKESASLFPDGTVVFIQNFK